MKKRINSFLKFILFLGFGIFLVWWSIHKMSEQDFNDFKNALLHAKYILFVPTFFILTLSHICRAIRWRILMKPMGYMPSFANTFCAVMIGYLANLAVPRLGEVLKCTILGKYEKVPPEKLVGTILIERATDIFSLCIVFIIAMLTQAKIISAYAEKTFEKYFLNQSLSTVLFKLCIVIFIGFILIIILKILFNQFAHLVFIQKIKGLFKGVIEGLKSIKNLENKKAFIVHSVIIWLCYIVGTFIGFYAIQQTSALPFLATFPVLAFASLGMIFAPGGIGLYPLFIAEVMALYQIDMGYGLANGQLQWAAQFLIILIIGFICLLILPYINKEKKFIGVTQ